MAASFSVRSASGDYPVSIQAGQFASLADPAKEQIVLADEFFAAGLQASGHAVIPLAAHETTKSLDRIPEIIEALRRAGASRKTTLVAVGGGIVQDVAGFVSTIFMRGIDWVYVPTTLLAMADSCIGGKSSINVGPYKNLVGAFRPPQAVKIDPELVETLSVEQRVAGLCEAAKICFCLNETHYRAYAALSPGVDASVATLAAVIELSLAAKTRFIEIDEFDQGERQLLNFGHTFGHAIEAASHFEISHGVAVGLGMLTARRFGIGVGNAPVPGGQAEALFAHVTELLAHVPDLPDAVRRLDLADLMDAFAGDKKHSRDAYVVIALDDKGAVQRLALPRDDHTTLRVSMAFAEVLAQANVG